MSKKEVIRELEIKNNDLRLKYNELVEKVNLSEKDNFKLRKDNQALGEENYRLHQENGALSEELKLVKVAHDYVEQNDFRKKAENYRTQMNSFIDKLNLCSEENAKLREAMERMSRKEVAGKSSEKTLVEIINIHCKNNQNYFNSIMLLLSQREEMQQRLNEKDYIICQLESALEAANVI